MCALTMGREIHEYERKGKDHYQTERHTTVVHDLP